VKSTPILGKRVTIGEHTLYAGSSQLSPFVLRQAGQLITLTGRPAENWSQSRPYLVYPIPDFGVPDPQVFRSWLQQMVCPALEKGTVFAVHCGAGLGRTGLFLASLLMFHERDIEDPVAEIRQRYHPGAVETRSQAAFVFALGGRSVPARYGRVPRERGR
jgi:protein-tyrosine phosphatase